MDESSDKWNGKNLVMWQYLGKSTQFESSDRILIGCSAGLLKPINEQKSLYYGPLIQELGDRNANK